MDTNPLRGLFGVSSPRTEAQGVAPQPASPTENICYEFPSGMLEKLLANPFIRDGTSHLGHITSRHAPNKPLKGWPFIVTSISKLQHV